MAAKQMQKRPYRQDNVHKVTEHHVEVPGRLNLKSKTRGDGRQRGTGRQQPDQGKKTQPKIKLKKIEPSKNFQQ